MYPRKKEGSIYVFFCKLLLILLFFHTRSHGQEQLGMRLESFAGTSGLNINPSSFLTGELGWDFQLGSAGAFFSNNYAFVENAGFFRLIKQWGSMEWALALNPNPPGGDHVFLVNFYDRSSKSYFHLNSFIGGPSCVTKFGDRQSIGVFTNLRLAGNSFNIPNELTYFSYNNRPFQQPFTVNPWDASIMSWMELGVHYGWESKGFDNPLFAGINLKYILGYESVYISNLSDYIHSKLPENTISLVNPEFRYGFTPIRESLPFFQRNGQGIGLDIGISKVLSEDREGYILKAGISIIDLGFIHFNKNSQAHFLDIDTTIFMHWSDYEDVRFPFELDDAVNILGSRSLEGRQNTLSSESYSLLLPTAISFQLDYKMTKHIYFNGFLVQNLRLPGRGPQRADILAFTPRWQNRFFSVSTPMTVFHWSKIHFGLATRIGGLTLGSDHIHGLFSKGNFSGMDLYVSLRLPSSIFGGKKNGLFGQRSSGIECFEF
ncbi:MAG TPA: DUF5723 family protein [Saprospiraceae bacterium]|mgnify:CR=1 FL=1|nr:DUF5723 family protein [Saprospiraceae bacterium]